MRSSFRLAVALVLLCVLRLHAQDAERAFRDAVLHKPLLPRDFSAEREMHDRYLNGKLEGPTLNVHELALFLTESVKVKKDRIELNGTRTALPDARHPTALVGMSKARVVVEFAQADRSAALATVAGLLFFPDLDAAAAAAPLKYASFLRKELGVDPARAKTSKCECTDRGTPACDGREPTRGARPPRVLRVVDPEFSEEARGKKFSGSVQVLLTVDEAGTPGDLWVSRPAGYGLDEQAMMAVSQYQFAPATCSGTAVPTALAVDVKFKIF